MGRKIISVNGEEDLALHRGFWLTSKSYFVSGVLELVCLPGGTLDVNLVW